MHPNRSSATSRIKPTTLSILGGLMLPPIRKRVSYTPLMLFALV
jgi:hypothetical protein